MVEILAATANLNDNQTRLLSASLTLLASTVLLDLDRGRAQRTTSHTHLEKTIHTKPRSRRAEKNTTGLDRNYSKYSTVEYTSSG